VFLRAGDPAIGHGAIAVRETLAVFVIALLFAYLLMPLVGFVSASRHAKFHRASRWPSFIWRFGRRDCYAGADAGCAPGGRGQQPRDAIAATGKESGMDAEIPLPSWLEPARASMIQKVEDQLSSGGEQILPYIEGLGGQLVSGAKYALYLVLIPILAFFFLKDGAAIRDEFVAALVEERRRPVVDNILEDINLCSANTSALWCFCLRPASPPRTACFSAFSGAPYAVLLAGVAALGEFVPVVGPAAGGLIVVLVTGLSGYSHVCCTCSFGCFSAWRRITFCRRT
jgi:predicted PurR-regulated permease PerM